MDDKRLYKTKRMRVSSRQRVPGSLSATSFTVEYDTSNAIDNVYRVVLTRANMLNLFPNVDAHNQTLTYTYFGSPATVQIPIGQYTAEELSVVITDLVGGDFTMVLDANNRIEITNGPAGARSEERV